MLSLYRECKVYWVQRFPPSPSRLPTSLKLRRDKTEGKQVSGVRSDAGYWMLDAGYGLRGKGIGQSA